MEYFESHAHYDDRRFAADRNAVFEDISNDGVKYVVNVACDIKSCKTGISLSKSYPFIYSSIGVHPHNVKDLSNNDENLIRNFLKEDKVVAVGEIGLDYHYHYSPANIQKDWFIRQIKIADETNFPIIVHSREACKDTLDIIKKYSKLKQGVIHCFSGSTQTAYQYIEMGFYIGIGGVITYSNAKKTVEVVKNIDLEHILIETDCPYLAPVPNRGKRNDSTNLVYVANKIAEIKGISAAQVCEQTMENAKKLFNLNQR